MAEISYPVRRDSETIRVQQIIMRALVASQQGSDEDVDFTYNGVAYRIEMANKRLVMQTIVQEEQV